MNSSMLLLSRFESHIELPHSSPLSACLSFHVFQVTAARWSFINIDRVFAAEVVRCMRLATLPGLDKKCRLHLLDKEGAPKDEIASIINKFHSIKKATRKPLWMSEVSVCQRLVLHTGRAQCFSSCHVQADVSADFKEKMKGSTIIQVIPDMDPEFTKEALEERNLELMGMILSYKELVEKDDDQLSSAGEQELEGASKAEPSHSTSAGEQEVDGASKPRPSHSTTSSGKFISVETLEKWFQATQNRGSGAKSKSRTAGAEDNGESVNINLLEELQEAMQQVHQQPPTDETAEPQAPQGKSKGKGKRKDAASSSAQAAKNAKKQKKESEKPKGKANKPKGKAKEAPSSGDDGCWSVNDDTDEESHTTSSDSESGDAKEKQSKPALKPTGTLSRPKCEKPENPKSKKPAKASAPDKKKGGALVGPPAAAVLTLNAKPSEHDRSLWENKFNDKNTDIYSDAPVLKSSCAPLTGTSEDVGRSALSFSPCIPIGSPMHTPYPTPYPTIYLSHNVPLFNEHGSTANMWIRVLDTVSPIHLQVGLFSCTAPTSLRRRSP